MPSSSSRVAPSASSSSRATRRCCPGCCWRAAFPPCLPDSLLHGAPGCHGPVVAPPRLAPAHRWRRKQRLLRRVQVAVREQPPYMSIALDRPVHAVSLQPKPRVRPHLPDWRDCAHGLGRRRHGASPGPRRHRCGLPQAQHFLHLAFRRA